MILYCLLLVPKSVEDFLARFAASGKAIALSLFYLSLFASPSPAFAESTRRDPRLEAVAKSKYWRILLHYRVSFFGVDRSEVDNPDFFFSPRGKHDPYAELEATIAAFSENNRQVGNLKQHPQCAYPARFKYLKRALNLDIPEVDCKEFREWIGRFQPQSVTFVFAAPFLGNPASIFGHTFLRIDSLPRLDADKNDLLDYGISFEALTSGSGGIALAVFGLLGFYPGVFTQHPYFRKTYEYTNIDSRDIWEYKLKMDPEQITQMLYHVWEMGNARFKYYFFDDNCAYQLLSLLEAGKPEWELRGRFPLWVIPSDTARVLRDAGAFDSAKYRPSAFGVLRSQVKSLSSLDRDKFSEFASGKLALNQNDSAPLLDSAINYTSYMTSPKPLVPRPLLLARAENAALSEAVSVATEDNKPDTGHESLKLALYGGSGTGKPFSGVFLRPVVHDLLDVDTGYLPWSELVILRSDLRYSMETKKIRLPELTIAEVISLAPVDAIRKRPSWMISGGIFSPSDFNCNYCSAFQMRGGYGYSAEVLPDNGNWIAFGLAKANFEYSGYFRNAYRAGPSLYSGTIYRIARNLKILLNGEYTYFPMENALHSHFLRLAASAAYTPRENFELRLEANESFVNPISLYDYRALVGIYY